jgi:hypothetical protein
MATTLWPPLANTKVSSQGPAAAIIEQAVPNYTVKRRISAGDLSDDGVENVELTIIPIFDKLDKAPLIPPCARHRPRRTSRRWRRADREDIAALRADKVELSGMLKGDESDKGLVATIEYL